METQITCPCCESTVESKTQIFKCSDCDFEGCGRCSDSHAQISGHFGDSPSSDTEASSHRFEWSGGGVV